MSITEEKARVSFRTDQKLKDDAIKVLSDMQLDLTTAFNLFLDQVVKQNKLPFEVTNETAEDKELREIKKRVTQGVLDAELSKGMIADEYLRQLKSKKAAL
ncbi:type II toxin-antitoxin system RelB/DinJ family antitoxin [Vagococcus sp. BWB3-3]|uniref:Type II toxin-antitoxin system RelB/DinJ family antitoxin n=1 Tax=Vagococcus allomyrinae TaxID=2794353 RepID=A0A940P275_9ENTE|nr:type II toxin-antitoxin system RelB/DinJ family antitoxin [Vagococcus allomyrinae]MBP1040117.1 type II toxin-antitoxin system RelB/DinJ family antitoxin [Vagococcus allomyrinae]